MWDGQRVDPELPDLICVQMLALRLEVTATGPVD